MQNKTKNLTGLAQLNPRRAGVRGYLMGFSFMEVMVAVFIFSLVIMTTTMIFSKMIKNYNRTKDIQRDMESAQQAMNLMAKTIRTSAISAAPPNTEIELYDYSQIKCIRYSRSVNNLEYQEYSLPSPPNPGSFVDWATTSCDFSSVPTLPMANGISDLRFDKTATDTTTAGRVAISMQVCPAGSCAGNDQVRIQTTVTLRESGYEETGL